MKFILFFLIFFGSVIAAEDKKDWVLDLKTSTLIPNYVGKVKVVRGKVMVGEKELEKGDKIYPKHFVKTEYKSLVIFEIIDEKTFQRWPISLTSRSPISA